MGCARLGWLGLFGFARRIQTNTEYEMVHHLRIEIIEGIDGGDDDVAADGWRQRK